MRRLISLTVLALASVSFAKVPVAVLDARPSAVQIILRERVEGELVYRPICSGAVVGLERGARTVSAGHCVAEDPEASYLALDFKGRLWPLTLEDWEFAWPKQDYAVFSSLATVALPALKVAAEECRTGDDIFSWSGPLGLNIMLFHGEIAGTLGAPYTPEADDITGMTFSSLEIDQGASGSIVLNDQGEAVAVLVGQFGTQVKLAGSFFAPLPK